MIAAPFAEPRHEPPPVIQVVPRWATVDTRFHRYKGCWTRCVVCNSPHAKLRIERIGVSWTCQSCGHTVLE